jgi:hypothetical protein
MGKDIWQLMNGSAAATARWRIISITQNGTLFIVLGRGDIFGQKVMESQ